MRLILRVQTPAQLIMLQQVSCSVLSMIIWKNTLPVLLSVVTLLHVFIRTTVGVISGSVGLGWLMNKESFLQNTSWIDMLKFKISYGAQGNDNIGNYYAYLDQYTVSNS